MSKNILIIGGSGFLGKNLIKRCKNYNWSIYATYYKNKINEKNVKSFFLDLSNPKIPKKYKINFDCVFFSAGKIDHNDKNSDDILNEHFYSVIKITDQLKIKKFFYLSTADEYKSSKKKLNENNSELSFKTFYALANHLAGQYLLTLNEMKILKTIVYRVFIIYGPGQNTNRFIPNIITSLINNKRFIILNGSLQKDFLYIDDFIDVIFQSIKKKSLYGKIVNIGSGKSIKLSYLGIKIFNLIKKGKVISYSKKSKKSGSQYSSISLIKKNTNWKPKVSIREGILKTINYYKK